MNSRRLLLSMATLAILIGIAGYRLGRAHADGIPTTTPLFYSGLIETAAGPIADGTQDITIRLWDDAAAGNTRCTTIATGTMVVSGHFRVALDPSCVAAIQSYPDLWVEPLLGSVSFGRTKLGTVPYAVEAARAAGASGTLATRLSSLESASSSTARVVSVRVQTGAGAVVSASSAWILSTSSSGPGTARIVPASGTFPGTPLCVCTAGGGIACSVGANADGSITVGSSAGGSPYNDNVSVICTDSR